VPPLGKARDVTDTIDALIYRYDAETGDEPSLVRYSVDVHENMSVLDLLFQIVEHHDPDVSFRFSCRVGMCGSCGMVIDGREGLACQTAVGDLGSEVTVRPMNHLPVQKDLLVDLGPLIERFVRVIGQFAGDPAREEIAQVDQATTGTLGGEGDCITCGLCLSACSMVSFDPSYVGPAALFRSLSLIEDPRQSDQDERLGAVNTDDGIWRCHNHMDCVAVCPKGLPLTDAIMTLKRMTTKQFLARSSRPGGGTDA
jgi:succinate dehydrogenase/fumarate reductase iron-sulfur protein